MIPMNEWTVYHIVRVVVYIINFLLQGATLLGLRKTRFVEKRWIFCFTTVGALLAVAGGAVDLASDDARAQIAAEVVVAFSVQCLVSAFLVLLLLFMKIAHVREPKPLRRLTITFRVVMVVIWILCAASQAYYISNPTEEASTVGDVCSGGEMAILCFIFVIYGIVIIVKVSKSPLQNRDKTVASISKTVLVFGIAILIAILWTFGIQTVDDETGFSFLLMREVVNVAVILLLYALFIGLIGDKAIKNFFTTGGRSDMALSPSASGASGGSGKQHSGSVGDPTGTTDRNTPPQSIQLTTSASYSRDDGSSPTT
eukprot:TRINITY_DN1622_c2_g1_i2.p1 TRINITY_DN1622_c2_g1~~TRINITY_DN1622_c2_g1_i2.p1  ORF type:complete len:313 (+),score=47.04 TRINITY_DN1622_c2_g1_i2:185-1123(+)